VYLNQALFLLNLKRKSVIDIFQWCQSNHR
jgi:hypothetical protein